MNLQDNSTRTVHIVAGSSTCRFEAPNKFIYKLPASGFKTGKDEVALKSLTLYYSWPNISAAKGNNTYSYMMNGVAYPVIMPDGIFQFSEFYAYLKQVMKQNLHYLIDDKGKEQYFIQLVTNSALYCLSLSCLPVPSTLPTDWTNPGMTLSGMTPQFVVSQSISSMTGFAPGNYPAVEQAGVYQVNSGIPQITDATSLNVLCNLVNSGGLSLRTNVLTSFVVPNDVGSGELIDYRPPNLEWQPAQNDQIWAEFTLEIVDQLARPIELRDVATFVATLNIRRRI